MATFAAVILKHRKKSNGTYNLKIRISHNNKKKYLPTQIYVTESDLTKKKLTLKQGGAMIAANEIIARYVKICNNHITSLDKLSMDDLCRLLELGDDNNKFALDFLDYCKSLEQRWHIKQKGKAMLIRATIASLRRFLKRDKMDISELNAKFMKRYADYLQEEPILPGSPVKRKVSLYCGQIRMALNLAKEEYNDEDLGIINIPGNPFHKFKIPKETLPEKRSIELELLRYFVSLPYVANNRVAPGKFMRTEIAKDLFIMSFYLIGMNAVDFFNAHKYETGILYYNRTKVKNRRSDNAPMAIKVPKEIWPLMEKYKDPSGERAFIFHKHYHNAEKLTQTIGVGLRKIREVYPDLGDIQFYSARHSWATIAANEVGIDKITVHEALCHVIPELKITDVYIRQDFSRINDANRKVLDYCKLNV